MPSFILSQKSFIEKSKYFWVSECNSPPLPNAPKPYFEHDCECEKGHILKHRQFQKFINIFQTQKTLLIKENISLLLFLTFLQNQYQNHALNSKVVTAIQGLIDAVDQQQKDKTSSKVRMECVCVVEM